MSLRKESNQSDKDWLKVGDGSIPQDINDNIYTLGKASVGTTNNTHTLNVASTFEVGSFAGLDTTYTQGGSGFGAKTEWRYADGVANASIAGNADSWLNADYGRLGVGTKVPAFKLDVIGKIRATDKIIVQQELGLSNTMEVADDAYGNMAVWRSLVPADGVNPFLAIKNSVNGTSINADGSVATNLKFEVGAIERMRIQANGNVGVNTTSPLTSLDVQGLTTGATSLANSVSNSASFFKGSSASSWGTAIGYSNIAEVGSQYIQAVSAGATATKPFLVNPFGGYVGVNQPAPTSSLDVNGSFALPIKTVTTSYSLNSQDHTIQVNNLGTAVTITLPLASSFPGRIYRIKRINNTSTGVITIAAPSLETRAGAIATTDTLDTYSSTGGSYGVRRTYQSDGVNWVLINN